MTIMLPCKTLRRINASLVENTVDTIIEELTDDCSRTFESDCIFILLNCARHVNISLKFIQITLFSRTKISYLMLLYNFIVVQYLIF